MVARDHSERGEDVRARQLMKRALAVAEVAPDRNDSLIAAMLNNLARKQEKLGDFVAAERTYRRAEDLARKTHGEGDATYAVIRPNIADAHQRGQRTRECLFTQSFFRSRRTGRPYEHTGAARRCRMPCCEVRAQYSIPLLEFAHRIY